MNITNPLASGKHAAYYNEKLFEAGIGHVIVARFKGGGTRVEAGVFLVDVWCLGVKDAFFAEMTPEEFQSRILEKSHGEKLGPIEPACARKLVEDAVKYALSHGIAPHPDYKKGARVFGGINAGDCTRSFTFGKDGKPLYFQGPHDSPKRVDFILRQLTLHRGEGNFDFVLGGPVNSLPGEQYDDDWEDDAPDSGEPEKN